MGLGLGIHLEIFVYCAQKPSYINILVHDWEEAFGDISVIWWFALCWEWHVDAALKAVSEIGVSCPVLGITPRDDAERRHGSG